MAAQVGQLSGRLALVTGNARDVTVEIVVLGTEVNKLKLSCKNLAIELLLTLFEDILYN